MIAAEVQKLLEQKTQFQKIDDLNSLTAQNLAGKNTLLVCKDSRAAALQKIKELQDSEIAKDRIFYLNNPSQIFSKNSLKIHHNEQGATVEIRPNSEFKDFISSGQECFLIIDWTAFNNKQILALNTILDDDSKFDGIRITNPTILSLCDKIPNDPSFLSRHNACLQLQEGIDQNTTFEEFRPSSQNSASNQEAAAHQSNQGEPFEVDLRGVIDWRQELFGHLALEKDEIRWQKSEFCQKIEEGCKNFKIINITKEAKKEFGQEMEIARAFGFYQYCGYKINAEFAVNFAENNLNFSQFFNDESSNHSANKLKIYRKNNSTSRDLPANYFVVNDHNFDFLIVQKEILNGTYSEKDGIVAERKNRELNLFITSKLSDQQHYLILKEALAHNVSLNLYLADGVKLPSKVESQTMDEAEVKTEENPKIPKIIIANDTDLALKDILSTEPDIYAVIDVEDYSYSQLFEGTRFTRDGNSFKDFQIVKSEFYEKLQEGKKIVLRGEFSSSMLSNLHRFLVGQDPSIAENLILLIEDKKIQQSQTKIDYLSFLHKDDYSVQYHESLVSDQTTFELFEDENKESEEEFKEKSSAKSKDFITNRKEKISGILQKTSLLQIVGHSGVGKSQLIKRLEEEPNYAVYNEMEGFEDWANDTSDKIKILFIDESNIDDSHLTKFSPLKNYHQNFTDESEKVRIFHNGKFYELGKNHKVVFARNPENYSAGRKPQKLLDRDVETLYLRDFPASYIYEEILKKPIYDQLKEDIKEKISEGKFKKECEKEIKNYQNFNKAKRDAKDDVNCMTVRELQEKILISIKSSSKPSADFEIEEEAPGKITNENFVSTDATKEVEEKLRNSIQIRGMQREGNFCKTSVGLNGVIIEGNPGIGKTEMIRAILNSEKIEEGTLDEQIDNDRNSKKPRKFYKIDSNCDPKIIKQIIAKAYEEGNIIWIDEINSIIDDNGLEKYLNAALTGKHPDSKDDISVTPGFMLISSINPPLFSGRSQISPALKSRLSTLNAKPLNQYTIEDLQKICEAKLAKATGTALLPENQSEEVAKSIAEIFKQDLSKEGSSLTLRDLSEVIITAAVNSENFLPKCAEGAGR